MSEVLWRDAAKLQKELVNAHQRHDDDRNEWIARQEMCVARVYGCVVSARVHGLHGRCLAEVSHLRSKLNEAARTLAVTRAELLVMRQGADAATDTGAGAATDTGAGAGAGAGATAPDQGEGSHEGASDSERASERASASVDGQAPDDPPVSDAAAHDAGGAAASHGETKAEPSPGLASDSDASEVDETGNDRSADSDGDGDSDGDHDDDDASASDDDGQGSGDSDNDDDDDVDEPTAAAERAWAAAKQANDAAVSLRNEATLLRQSVAISEATAKGLADRLAEAQTEHEQVVDELARRMRSLQLENAQLVETLRKQRAGTSEPGPAQAEGAAASGTEAEAPSSPSVADRLAHRLRELQLENAQVRGAVGCVCVRSRP